MVRSMTGFGRSAREISQGRVTVEIRTVNHRFSDISAKLPKQWNALEDKVRRWAGEHIYRGRVEVAVYPEENIVSSREVHINWPLLEQFQQKFAELKAATGSSEEFPAAAMLQHSDILQIKEQGPDMEILSEELQPVIEEAAGKLIGMRETEGRLLQQDLQTRMKRFFELKEKIVLHAAEIKHDLYKRMRQRMKELLSGVEIDENRLLTETAVHVEKSDVLEELTRIDSHSRQFLTTLAAEGAVGRKLDFLLQELNREVNTIGSKAASVSIGSLVVDMKDELEKMREQVQNIE